MSETSDEDDVSDIDPAQMAKAKRALIVALHREAQRLLRELGAHLDDVGAWDVEKARIAVVDAARGHLGGRGWTADERVADLTRRASESGAPLVVEDEARPADG